MKKIIIALLIFGMVFSAGSFPNEITGTGLQLVEYSGDTENGEAHYMTPDEVTIAIVNAAPLDQMEWQEYKKYYDDYGVSSETVQGIEFYYYCEEISYDYYTNEAVCYVDFYQYGIYYMIDVSVLDGTTYQALNTAEQIGVQISGGSLGNICPCPVALILIGLALASIGRSY